MVQGEIQGRALVLVGEARVCQTMGLSAPGVVKSQPGQPLPQLATTEGMSLKKDHVVLFLWRISSLVLAFGLCPGQIRKSSLLFCRRNTHSH